MAGKLANFTCIVNDNDEYPLLDRKRLLFYLYSMDGTDVPAVSTDVSHQGESGHPHPQRVLLIVDDTAMVRQAVRTVLESTHLFTQVLEAETGLQALEMMQHTTVDLLIADVIMAPIDGYKLTSTIKRNIFCGIFK